MSYPTADQIIETLKLIPHPEGGAFRETFRAPESVGDCSAATLIYFLLRAGEISRWHRVLDSPEHFLYQGGDAYLLRYIDLEGKLHNAPVGLDLTAGERPQQAVPAGCWQAGAPREGGPHGWTLVACLVSPGFDFASFELATVEEMAARYPGLAGQL